MISCVAFDINNVASDPPVKFLAGDNHFVKSTCVIDLPFGVVRSFNTTAKKN